MGKITDIIDSGQFIAQLGGIIFSGLKGGSFWLENADGEGTQVSRDLLEEKMQDLFDELM